MTAQLSVRVVRDDREFESLRETWDGLLQKSADNHIYLTYEWLFTWWQHYSEGRKLNILLVEDEGTVLGIVPLMESTYGKGPLKFRVLETIAAPDCDYGGAILTERQEEAVDALLAHLEARLKGGRFLRLPQVPQESQFLGLVKRRLAALPAKLVWHERVQTTCPYIALPATWQEYLGTLRRKRRGNLRRALESLKREHQVEFRESAAGDSLAEPVAELFELQRKRWHSLNLRKGMYSDPRARAFYLDAARALGERGWLCLSMLSVDGRAASAVYGLRYGQRFYYTVTAFDPDCAEYSIGHLHIQYLVEKAIADGLKEFDFLIGDEPYKRLWGRSSRNNVELLMVRHGLLSGLRLRLFPLTMRLGHILRRGLRENFYLFRLQRREARQKREEGG